MVSSITMSLPSLSMTQVPCTRAFYPNSLSLSTKGRNFPSITLQPRVPRFQVACAAKPETVEKVCSIVKKQLALPDDSSVSGESKFSALGADSLDTVFSHLSILSINYCGVNCYTSIEVQINNIFTFVSILYD
ncbi:putative phosphopantetheine binding ACP domain-containing protein [Lupinus albus]|uniref:Putative phosphopantetheine binding ACP domain-containing protein n=1 Tax=Lupinus albus TaxID=3870 RepID=A0A6A4PAA6_LUPAL|nr:putative phosphopantetheine binding ACP domain-containing protein [Lupinus albus]